MRELYYYPLCPFCRKVRIYLKECMLDCNNIIQIPNCKAELTYAVESSYEIPIFIDLDETIISGSNAIISYLEERNTGKKLGGSTTQQKAEIRRLSEIFDTIFYADVVKNIVFEKIMKKFFERSAPDSSAIRKGFSNIKKYLDYISWLTDRRNWIAGDEFSLADTSAVAQISTIDYLGAIEWNQFEGAKDWYIRAKSRPCMREILTDRISGISPSANYSLLDW